MRLLLDIHTLVWAPSNRMKLPPGIRAMLVDASHEISFSAASIFEIAVRRPSGAEMLPFSHRQMQQPLAERPETQCFR